MLQEIIAAKTLDSAAKPEYEYIQGILRYNGRLCIGNNEDLRLRIMQHIHDSSLGGHSGMQGSYKRAKSIFHWKGMKNDIFTFVHTCDICKMNKHEPGKVAGLLQPLPVPEQAWTHISMDLWRDFQNQMARMQ